MRIGTEPCKSCSVSCVWSMSLLTLEEEDTLGSCCVGVLRLGWDCNCEGVHCLLSALQGIQHSVNMQHGFEDLP